MQTGELDGIAWSGITEDYTVGWADVTNYFLTNNISGAWCGSYFANSEKWNALPAHLQELFRLPGLWGAWDSSHYYQPVLVLGRRGGSAGQRHEAGAELDPGRGMGDGGDGSGQVLGRDRGRDAAHRQGGRHPAGVQRGDGQGGTALPLHLSEARCDPRPGGASRAGVLRPETTASSRSRRRRTCHCPSWRPSGRPMPGEPRARRRRRRPSAAPRCRARWAAPAGTRLPCAPRPRRAGATLGGTSNPATIRAKRLTAVLEILSSNRYLSRNENRKDCCRDLARGADTEADA